MADPALRPITVNGVTVDFDAGLLRDPGGTEIPLRAQSFAVLSGSGPAAVMTPWTHAGR